MKTYRVGIEYHYADDSFEVLAVVRVTVPDTVSKDTVREAFKRRTVCNEAAVEKLLKEIIEENPDWSYEFENTSYDIWVHN